MEDLARERKILVIMGSPHKGNTFRACEEIREHIQQEMPVDFEYLWLKDTDLKPCRGCLVCFSDGEEQCPIHDDAFVIRQKMREADGVIFASPVYGMNVTGQMKVFIDRFSYTFHRPEFFDKKSFLLTTTGILGHKDVLKYLEMVAGIWGFEIAGKAGLVTPLPLPDYRKEENQQVIRRAARDFAASFRRERRKSPGLRDVIIFHGQRAAFSQLEEITPADYRYWKEKGWLEKGVKYFVDVPVNPVYHLIGTIIGWFSGRQVRKDIQS